MLILKRFQEITPESPATPQHYHAKTIFTNQMKNENLPLNANTHPKKIMCNPVNPDKKTSAISATSR